VKPSSQGNPKAAHPRRSRRRKGWALVLATGVIAALLAVGASNAYACNPIRTDNYPSDYWNGWRRPIDTLETQFKSITANIDDQSPFNYQTPRCSSKACDFTYDWIMLSNNDENHWAQIGPATLHDGNRYSFVQCNTTANGISNAYLDPFPPGSTPTYEVYELGGGNGIALYANAEEDTCTNATFTVGHAEAATEMLTEADQVPGSTSNHDNFNNVLVGMIDGTTENLFTNGAHYKTTPGSADWDNFGNFSGNNHVETWDGYCA
jgi:hypothetical protein